MKIESTFFQVFATLFDATWYRKVTKLNQLQESTGTKWKYLEAWLSFRFDLANLMPSTYRRNAKLVAVCHIRLRYKHFDSCWLFCNIYTKTTGVPILYHFATPSILCYG